MSGQRAERAYLLLLRAYPREFRAAYGRAMTTTFRDLLGEADTSRVRFWLEIIADVARTAPAQHADALRVSWSSDTRTEEKRMKQMWMSVFHHAAGDGLPDRTARDGT